MRSGNSPCARACRGGHLPRSRDWQIDDPRLRTRFAGVDLAESGRAGGRLRQELRADRRVVLSRLRLPDGRLDHARAPCRQSVSAPGPLSADRVACRRHGRAEPRARILCRAPRRVRERRVPVFANIGGFSAETIAASFFAVEPHVDAVEISLMCPNLLRPGEHFDDIGLLKEVLGRIAARRKPAIVRVPNDTARSVRPRRRDDRALRRGRRRRPEGRGRTAGGRARASA